MPPHVNTQYQTVGGLYLSLRLLESSQLGSALIDFFDILQSVNAPEWLSALIADGVGDGILLVASFIPVNVDC